jgi:hypothetical protein
MSAVSLVSRASFELDVDSVARGRAVQQRVSAFAHGRLPAVIDAVLADVAGGATCFIERIELDLGQLSEATLETQLAEGVRRALMASLLHHGLGRRESGEQVAGDRGAASAGVLAWPALRAWMDGGGATPPEAQMLRALRDSRLELLRLVRELGQRQAVRQRLARQLTRAALEQLVRALEPAEAQLIVDYVAQAGRLHRRRPLVPESRHSFSAALWEFVLSYLLLERGSYFDTRALVGHTLLLMARRYGVGYADLLRQLADSLHGLASPASEQAGLMAILHDLRGAVPADAAIDGAAPRSASAQLTRRTAGLRYLLEHGIWPEAAGLQARATLAQELAALQEDAPADLVALLRASGGSAAVCMRLAQQLPEAQLERLAALLEPRHGEWIATSLRSIRQLQARERLVPDDAVVFGRRLWEFALRVLLVDRGSYFNTRSFVKSLLEQMAARHGMAYRALLHALLRMAPALPASRSHGLPAILRSLRQECAPATAVLTELEAELPADGGSVPVAPAQFARAAREFTMRCFRLDRGSHFNNRSYVQDLLHQLCARHGMAYAQLLHGLCAGARAADAPGGLSAILAELRSDAAPARAGAGVPAAGIDPVRDFLLHGRMAGLPGMRDGLHSWDGEALASALRDSARRAGVIERLIHYLPAPELVRLLAVLAPRLAGFIETCVLTLQALERDGRFPASQRAMLPTLAWRAALRVLLAHNGHDGSSARLLAALLHWLSPRLGLTLPALRARLQRQARTLAPAQPRFLVLADMLADMQGGAPEAAPAPAATPFAPDAALLAGLLRHGMRTTLALAPELDQASLLLRLGLAMAAHPADMRAVLLRAGSRELELQRYAFLLPAALHAQALALLLDGATAARAGWWQAILARAVAAAAPAATTGSAAHWTRILSAELLRALATARGHHDVLARYLAGLPRRLAQRHGVSPQTLSDALRAELARGGPAAASRAGKLPAVFERAARAAPPAVRRTEPPVAEALLPEGEAIHIANAGLVILWPFLDRYFQMLGLQQDGAFAGFAEQCRAVHLLHYLVHGSVEAQEADLLLDKILCGLAPTAALETAGPLSAQESDVSAQVLAAAIGHWDRLGDTDAEGLQLTFLRRAGRLVRSENDWTLTVEKHAFDVLMSALPWTLGTIRLSWMSGTLTVVWP